jgi:hypothetical protein
MNRKIFFIDAIIGGIKPPENSEWKREELEKLTYKELAKQYIRGEHK